MPLRALNNAGARPGASWKRPGGGSRFPWVEGRLSGWSEEKPSPGSGGEYRREGGRSLLQEVGWGEDVGEARRSDSQDLPCWECQPKIFCPHPNPSSSGAALYLGICPIPGSAMILRSSFPRPLPSGGAGWGQGGNLGLRAGLKGQQGTRSPDQASLPA